MQGRGQLAVSFAKGTLGIIATVKGNGLGHCKALIAAMQFCFYIVSMNASWLTVATVLLKVEVETGRQFKVMFYLGIECFCC